MKKILGIIILVLLWFVPVNATERYHDEVNWTGKCFIQYEGKTVVDNETCEMTSRQMPRDDYDDFTIIVTKYVNCDDGSKGCAYFFYAYQSKLLEKYFYSIGYNVWKDSTRAGLTISPTDIDYYEAGQNVGACFFKEDNKFCFEFKE